MTSKQQFLYPRSRYYGGNQPAQIIFNANLQEFAQRTEYICNLHSGGKLSSHEAFEKLQALWQAIEHSKHELSIDTSTDE